MFILVAGLALLHSRQRRLYSAAAPYNPKKKAPSGLSISMVAGVGFENSPQRRLYSAFAPYNPSLVAGAIFENSRQRRLYSAAAPYNPKKKAPSGFLFLWLRELCLKTPHNVGYIPLSLHITLLWLRELDLNQRPSGYEPDELPSCSIPRRFCHD